jgi:hypothetical protein
VVVRALCDRVWAKCRMQRRGSVYGGEAKGGMGPGSGVRACVERRCAVQRIVRVGEEVGASASASLSLSGCSGARSGEDSQQVKRGEGKGDGRDETRCGRAQRRKAEGGQRGSVDVSLAGVPRGEQQQRIRQGDAGAAAKPATRVLMAAS